MPEEIVEKIEEKVAEVVEEKTEKAEQVVEEVRAESSEAAERVKKSKLHIAKEKIEKAKVLTAETKNQIEECMKNIDADIEIFESKKQALFAEALHPAEVLLGSIANQEEEVAVEVPSTQVELLDLGEDEVEIKDPSSGRFKGFFWALVAGLGLAAGWCYWVSTSLGLPIPPEKIPDFDRLNKMLEWTAGKLGQEGNANIGAAALIIAALLLMWIVYALIVSVRASSNLRTADKTEEAVKLYCTNKEECKEKMKLVREHVQNSTGLVEKYQVLLEEQNAKLKRALFFEEAEGIEGLHAKTKDEIAATKSLIADVKALVATPVSEAGMLTEGAEEALRKANKAINEYIMKIYL